MSTNPVPLRHANGYDAKKMNVCAHEVFCDFAVDPALADPPTPMLASLFAAGNAHEAARMVEIEDALSGKGYTCWTVNTGEPASVTDTLAMLDRFAANTGPQRLWLNIVTPRDASGSMSGETKATHEHLSEAALDAGAHGGFNWRLVTPGRVGVLDAATRVDQSPGPLSHAQYLVIDMKDHKALTGSRRHDPGYDVSPLAAPFLHAVETEPLEGVPHLVDSMQGAHYWHQLRDLGHHGPTLFGVIGRERNVIWRDLRTAFHHTRGWDTFDHTSEFTGGAMSAMDIYRIRFAEWQRLAALSEQGAAAAPTRPEYKQRCTDCKWRTVCMEELTAQTHVSLLRGVTVRVSRRLETRRVVTQQELASLHVGNAQLIDAGVDLQHLAASAQSHPPDTRIDELVAAKHRRLFHSAGINTIAALLAYVDPVTAAFSGAGITNLGSHIDQARVTLEGRVFLARGQQRLCMPRAHYEEDHDIEDSDGVVYLAGNLTTIQPRRRSRFTPVHTWVNTVDAVHGLYCAQCEHWDTRIQVARRAKRSLAIYHYTAHEDHHWQQLADTFAGRRGGWSPQQMAEFLAHPRWVDMYPLLTAQLVWPTPSRSLKSLATHAGYSWAVEGPGGANSLAQYALAVGDDPAEHDRARRWLIDYNTGDVEAQLWLRQWIDQDLRHNLAPVEDLDARWDPLPQPTTSHRPPPARSVATTNLVVAAL